MPLILLAGTVNAKTTTVICEMTDVVDIYQIDTTNGVISHSFKFRGTEQIRFSKKFKITFENENIIFGEYLWNHKSMPPAGKLEGQIDRYTIVFNRKSSIVKAIGLSTNEYYEDPDMTHLYAFEQECSVQF